MKITERRIDVVHGSEGPRHDPYSWTEYRVKLNGKRYTLRMGGLGYVRLLIDGAKVAEDWDSVHEYAMLPERSMPVIEWQRLTGMSFDKFETWYDRVHPWFDDPMGYPSQYI